MAEQPPQPGKMTRRWHRWTALAVAMAFMLAMQPDAEARPKRLDSDQVTSLLRGNTVYGFNPGDDSTYVMFHSANGTVRVEVRTINGSVLRSDGHWWINNLGQLCIKWKSARLMNSCATVNDDGEGGVTFTDDNGRIISFGEVETGNPDAI